MALRRKLPSRMTPDSAPESAAAPEKQDARSPRAQSSTPVQAPAPQPEEPVVTAPAASQSDALAAAAASAFGTIGTARVLEDSFTAAPAPQRPEDILPEPQPVAEEPVFSAPAWEAPATPAIAAAPMPAAPEAQPEPVFTASAWDQPAAEPELAAVSPFAPEPEKNPEPAAEEPVFSAPAWEAPAAEPAPAPEPAPQPVMAAAPQPEPEAVAEPIAEPIAEPAPQPIPAAQQVTDFMPKDNAETPAFQASRPDGNSRRRNREKRPRDFTAMGAPENQQAERPKPAVSFASHVPVNTKPLDKVDEDLIATGIMAPPPADSLTGSLPTGVAETESRFTPPPYEAAAPVFTPAPQPEPVAAAPTPQPEPQPEPKIEVKPEPAPQPQPAPQPEPKWEPKPLPDTEPEEAATEAPILAPQPEKRSSFTLSNQPKAADTLPPPQSDLPWTQPQSSAEWEIETPQSEGWHMEAAPATPSPAHMPPPGDLYGAMNSGPSAPTPSFAATPRSSTNFTPEIPAQRRRQAGTPWALVAVAGLVAVGAGAWYMRSGGSQQAQQQLAQLTSGARQDGTPTQDGILPPPSDNSSFYTPPLASDVSSASVVNFADVSPDQAGQPIVADGTEQVPDELSLAERFKAEIDKARAEKQGEKVADVSGTAQPTQAATSAALDRQKLNDELAAYRSALAQSGNPSELTPANFRRDPDGFMDGKPQQAAGTPAAEGELASGQLLPPPSGSSAAVLPPPELYTNNPGNLPVVAEPVAGVPQRVRTLADFPDVEAYMPEREKVEIPRGLKPKLAATDFPSLEVLSFVPGKGIVAFADGREGVLLIGESINGWELVAVSPENAEFKTGQRSHQVTAEN